MEVQFFLGIDWGNQVHQVCLLDREGNELLADKVEQSGRAIGRFLDRLARHVGEAPEALAAAIELPRGAWVDMLLERGFAVYAVNPKQLDRWRDRHTVAGAKDDRRDAYVLADALRTDRHRMRRLEPEDPAVLELRTWNRLLEEGDQSFRRVANRLRDVLVRYYPALLRLVPAADEPWLWDLLEIAPTPDRGRRLPAARILAILRRHRIRRFHTDAVREVLRDQPLRLAPGATEAHRLYALALVPELRLHHQCRRETQTRIHELLERLQDESRDEPGQKTKHRDVRILLSCSGVGERVAATMLVEASQPLDRRDYHTLRALAGVAPVTRQSGCSRRVVLRRACNRRLRDAVHHWARVASQVDPRYRAYYVSLRGRGHGHARALRSVADRLFNVLVILLVRGETYQKNHNRPVVRAA